jgi:S-adenosylhomocysteine hydrolase
MAAPASKFKVADISLAAFGRREIELAENEMPGLMEVSDVYNGVFVCFNRINANSHVDSP